MIILSIEETLLNWLWDHVPHLLIIGFIVVGTVWITIQAMGIKHRFAHTEKQCEDLRNKHVPDLHRRVMTIDGKINLLLISVGKISTHLITASGLASNIFEAHSPLELSAFGHKILTDTGGKKYIDENEQILMIELEKKTPKSGLDVQNYSNLILTEKTSDDSFTHIKNYIFQNPVYTDGTYKTNLDIGLTTQIMGIYLRNIYFEKYPDLKKDL